MRKSLIIALGAAVALVTAAVAIAVVPTAVGVSEATAEFSTNAVDKLSTGSCTADGKTWQITRAHYTGTVTGSANPILNGPLTIHAKTTTVDGLGYVEGSFKVRDDDSRLSGKFSGTLKGTALVGFLTAKSKGNHAKVLGNVSATFTPSPAGPGFAAFSSGKLGSAATGALAVVAGPVCKTPKAPKPPKTPKPKHVSVEGQLTTLTLATPNTPGTVVVTGKKGPQQCTIPAASTLGTGIALLSKVELKCEEMGSPAVMTATKLKLHK